MTADYAVARRRMVQEQLADRGIAEQRVAARVVVRRPHADQFVWIHTGPLRLVQQRIEQNGRLTP